MLNHFIQNRRVKALFKKHEVFYDEELIFTTAEGIIKENDVVLLNPITKEELNYSLNNNNYSLARCALIYTYHNGKFDLFKDLLNENSDSTLTKNLILIKAIIVGRLNIIKILMNEELFEFNIKNMYLESLCYHMINKEDIAMLNFMLKNKEKILEQCGYSLTKGLLKEIQEIKQEEKIDIFITLLMKSKIDISANDLINFIRTFQLNENNNYKKTQEIILNLMKYQDYDENELNKIMLESLKRNYINVTKEIHQNLLFHQMMVETNQLLGYSCDLGYIDMCKYILPYVIDLNAPYSGYWHNQDKGEPKSMTPIIGAIIGKHKDIILFLIENNCEINMDTIKKYSTDEEIIEFVEKLVNKRQLEQTLLSKNTFNNKPKL